MAKNQPFLTQLPNATLDFDEIWPKVAEYGLSSFDANLYVRKNLDLKIIHLILLKTIGLRKLKVFELRYLILWGELNGMKTDPYM